uniref:Secologanin synthase n=1 Tax=Anthurium amnicola TaxID=1678845 RepID=A0A1D1Y640_9ARAE
MPSFSHDIAPRVAPLLYQTMKTHGRISFTWFGPHPRVIMLDPELVREILSNKFGHFRKARSSPIASLIVKGLATYDGEKWAIHRRIINPAFHVEKLKRINE